MTRIITYTLKAAATNSDEYHETISSFADYWLGQSKPEVMDLLNGFRAHQQSQGTPDRSDAEYNFELLALGVLLREHGKEANLRPRWAGSLMRQLVEIQNRLQWTEPVIKTLRGWLGWLAGYIQRNVEKEHDLNRMLAWLAANDETVKANKFKPWGEYFKANGLLFTQSALLRCINLANHFEGASQSTLGKYTEKVEHFLAVDAPKHRCRYDARLLASTRLEYHLGMLGTEILNRAYRQRFLSTEQKMVIVPPCMCAPAKTCEAVETPFGARCQACTPGCRVNQITKLGEKRGFSVTMIPDDMKVFGTGKEAKSVGLVGVSCALTNWNGGWDTGEAGIPAQGLLLDYVGCKFHWDETGIPTDTNIKQLQKILDV